MSKVFVASSLGRLLSRARGIISFQHLVRRFGIDNLAYIDKDLCISNRYIKLYLLCQTYNEWTLKYDSGNSVHMICIQIKDRLKFGSGKQRTLFDINAFFGHRLPSHITGLDSIFSF